jgi:hypothetical protein
LFNWFKVEYKADSLYLPLLVLAKEGHHLISSVGSISYHCSPVEPIAPVTFTSSASHLVSSQFNSFQFSTWGKKSN